MHTELTLRYPPSWSAHRADVQTTWSSITVILILFPLEDDSSIVHPSPDFDLRRDVRRSPLSTLHSCNTAILIASSRTSNAFYPDISRFFLRGEFLGCSSRFESPRFGTPRTRRRSCPLICLRAGFLRLPRPLVLFFPPTRSPLAFSSQLYSFRIMPFFLSLS